MPLRHWMQSWVLLARPAATPRPLLPLQHSSETQSTPSPVRSSRLPPVRPRAGPIPILWPNGRVKPPPDRPSWSGPFASSATSLPISSESRVTSLSRSERTLPDTTLVSASSIEDTAPLGGKRQPPYLNQMVLLETRLEPRQLLQALQAIEQVQGRERTKRWGSRTLDLDIVRFGDRRVAEPDLIIPHPELSNRDFWRRELAELKPDER